MSKQMNKLQQYQICETALNNALGIMRDVFGGDFLKWEDKTARKVYEDLLMAFGELVDERIELKKKEK